MYTDVTLAAPPSHKTLSCSTAPNPLPPFSIAGATAMTPPPYGSITDARSWTADAVSHCSTAEIDGLLAGAGYRVRSSDLRHVAQSLERLDGVMISADDGADAGIDYLASSAVHYNPTDLTSWVDSMLGEVSADPLTRAPPQIDGDSWSDQLYAPLPPPAAAAARQLEEDSGIRLVHLLMSCGDAVHRGDAALAGSLMDEMRMILSRVNTSFGIGKVAGYFLDALCRRLYSPAVAAAAGGGGASPAENEILYHHFYEACPYLKFAHFTANQAILEAFEGHDRVHVVDFSLMHGLQWPALIQALALRPGGPPFLRITGIGPPSHDGRDHLREIGLRLADLARSVHVKFAFRGVAATRLDDVKPWMLQVVAGEALAVNSVLQLHRLLGDPAGGDAPPPPAAIDSVLGWVAGLKPKIVTVVEQEADHNKADFLERFTEALFYYSTMFDSLEGGKSASAGGGGGAAQQTAAVAEVYLQRELCNVVCCEGVARVERHEPLTQWRNRLGRAGLRAVHLGSNAFKQARMLLTLFSGAGYCVEEIDGCLTLGWHSRPLISASAWTAAGVGNSPAHSGGVNFGNGIQRSSMLVNNSGSSSSNGSSCSNSERQRRIIGM